MTRTAAVFRRKRPPADAAEKEILDPCQGKLWLFFFCLLPTGLGIMRENLCRTQAVALAFECNLESGIRRCLFDAFWQKARERLSYASSPCYVPRQLATIPPPPFLHDGFPLLLLSGFRLFAMLTVSRSAARPAV
jgi:hypothetical protein